VISDTEVIRLDKGEDKLAVLGLSLDDAKALLAQLQAQIVTAPASSQVGHRPPSRTGADEKRQMRARSSSPREREPIPSGSAVMRG